MKKILFSALLAVCVAMMFTSCSNDETVGTDKFGEYKANFEKVFGQVSPAQNFSTQKTVTIDASVQNANGNYTLKVYDGKPGKKGTSLLGEFENLNAGGVSTVKVGISKSSKNIYCVADDGVSRKLTSSAVPASGRMTAKFETADGAPTEETTDEVSSVTVAFEDLGSTDDFDFNDAVVKVNYATGTGVANVTLMAVGAVLPLKLYYVDVTGERQPLFDGQELHEVMGYSPKTIINTNWKTKNGITGANNVEFVTTEIEVPEDFVIGEDGAPFVLEVNGTEGQRKITASTEYGAVPQVLVVGKYYDERETKTFFYRWPKERVSINLAFPEIANWITTPDDLSFLAGGSESNLYDGYDPTVVDGQSTEAPEISIYLPEGTTLSVDDLTILGDGEILDVNDNGTFSSSYDDLVAFNKEGEIVYISFGNSNEERVLGPVETALALLLPTIPNAITEFEPEYLQAFKMMTALLRPTYDLVQAIKESVVEYNCLNMDAIQPQLTAAVRELHHRCGLDQDHLVQARQSSISPRWANNSDSRPAYPYFRASNNRKLYYDFITVQMTDAQLKEKDGSKYWACMFDVYNDNRFCYTSFTKCIQTADGYERYDDSWADTFRYLIKPYNLSEFMDLGLVSDLAYDPEHFITTLVDYDYSEILEDPVIARFWEPFARDRITTYDKTVKRDISIDFYTDYEHLVLVGPNTDDDLLLFNIVKIAIQPVLKVWVKSGSKSKDLDEFTEGFLKWISEADINFRADLLQHFKDSRYSMLEKIVYAWDKLSDRIEEYVLDELYDAASEATIKSLFGNTSKMALKDYKLVMNTLKTGYVAGDILQFMLDSQYNGFFMTIEQGYGYTNGTIPNVPGSDF